MIMPLDYMDRGNSRKHEISENTNHGIQDLGTWKALQKVTLLYPRWHQGKKGKSNEDFDDKGLDINLGCSQVHPWNISSHPCCETRKADN